MPQFNTGELRAFAGARTLQDNETPDVVLALPAGTRPNALAFDARDNLWVSDNAGNRLLMLAPNQLEASGAVTPAVRIDSDGTSLQSPIGMAFDAAGNLWVAAASRLEMFAPEDLDESGPTTARRTLTAAGFDIPAGLAFDGAGNLWLTNASFTMTRNAVLVFTPDDLAAGGARTPRLRIESGAFALVEGIQLDAGGDLWVANNDGFSVARFAAENVALPMVPQTRMLTPDGSLEADADDTPAGRTVRKPGGIVFDADGNLFVNSQRGGFGSDISGVVKFTAAQVAALGAAAATQAAVVLARTSSNPGFGGLALQVE